MTPHKYCYWQKRVSTDKTDNTDTPSRSALWNRWVLSADSSPKLAPKLRAKTGQTTNWIMNHIYKLLPRQLIKIALYIFVITFQLTVSLFMRAHKSTYCLYCYVASELGRMPIRAGLPFWSPFWFRSRAGPRVYSIEFDYPYLPVLSDLQELQIIYPSPSMHFGLNIPCTDGGTELQCFRRGKVSLSTNIT